MPGESKKPISLAAYARHRRVSPPAVTKAVHRKRLNRSVVYVDGKPKIADVALADREWQDNGDFRRRPAPPQDVRADLEGPAAPEPNEDDIGPDGPLHASTLTEAQRLLTLERLREKRLETLVTRGILVKKADVAKVLYEGDKILREALMNIPARLSGTLAATTEAGAVHQLLDAALREALQGTADRYEAAAHG